LYEVKEQTGSSNLFDKQDSSKMNPLGLSTDIFPEFIAVKI